VAIGENTRAQESLGPRLLPHQLSPEDQLFLYGWWALQEDGTLTVAPSHPPNWAKAPQRARQTATST